MRSCPGSTCRNPAGGRAGSAAVTATHEESAPPTATVAVRMNWRRLIPTGWPIDVFRRVVVFGESLPVTFEIMNQKRIRIGQLGIRLIGINQDVIYARLLEFLREEETEHR
jgi:hypothetical protein